MAGIDHDYVVSAFGDLNAVIDSTRCCIRTQVTLSLSETYDPIPDAMILRGPSTTYRRRRPVPADVLCLIEVSDSSYDRDSGEKKSAYAAAGIGCYVIINLPNRVAEVYTNPEPAEASYASYPAGDDCGSFWIARFAGRRR